jgi:hypothetical protein
MAIKTKCLDEARKALNLFTSDELEDYIRQVTNRTKELQDEGVPFARDVAMKETNNSQLQNLLDDSARAARNMAKFDVIHAKMYGDVPIHSFLEKTAKNTDYNIETANNAAKQELHTKAFGQMTKEDLDKLTEGELDDVIFSVADGQEHSDTQVKLIGTALKEYVPIRNAKLIQSDAMRPSEMSEDRFFRNNYNPSKLLKIGRENWITMHKSFIDIKATFKNTKAMGLNGEIDERIVDEIIGNSFDNIIEGNGALFTRPSVARDKEAIERTRHMFYKYKDWKNWGMANKAYGQGNLMRSWLNDINTSGNQIGMAQIMGTAPERMYLEMRHIQVAKQDNTIINKAKLSNTDALFNNLLGANKGAFDPKLANLGSSIRSISSMARLGKIVLRSIPDLANIAGMAQRAGAGYWKSYFDAITHSFNLMPDESRRLLARTMSHSLNVHAGTVSRYIDTSGMGETINKMSNRFFHGVALNAWDQGNKYSAMAPLVKTYGRQSSKSFTHLEQQQQAYLSRFNISEQEWDALRTHSEKNLFSTDNVTRMTHDEIKELWNKSDKIIPLSEYQSALYRKVYAMFDTAHEFSVLNPTAYTNMITTGNLRSGTRGGEAIRIIMQFKGYPIQYMKRVWVGGMQDFDSYQGKLMYATNMMLGTMMLAGLSETLNAIASGLTPPDPTKMSRGEQIKYYTKLLAGGMGVFGTILNDKATAKTVAASLVATPSLRFVADPLISGFALATGNLKGSKNAVKDFINVANPIGTLPVISPYVDAFLGNKPYMEPGQKLLF